MTSGTPRSEGWGHRYETRLDDKITLYPKFRGQLLTFDLNKALHGARVVTKLGYEVIGLRRLGHTLHGVVQGQISHWDLNGKFPIPGPAARILDLYIGVPAKVTFLTRFADRLETFFLGSRRTV